MKNKTLKKLAGVFFIISGIGSLSEDAVIALVLMIIGVLIFKSSKKKKRKSKPRRKVKSNDIPKKQQISSPARMKPQIIQANNIEDYSEFGLHKPRYDFYDAKQFKQWLDKNRLMQKKLIRNNTAVEFYDGWTVNNSAREGKKMIKGNIKVILRYFNAESEAAIFKVSYKNRDTIKNRIIRSFEQLNQAFEPNEVRIAPEYLSLKLDEVEIGYLYEKAKQAERDALREEREKQREEKALQEEIDHKRSLIKKEKNHFNNVIRELEVKRASSSNNTEKESLTSQLENLYSNLNKFDDEEKELDYRIEHIGAGYVYIISNIGAFGEGIFKIGVTRRLEAYDRINELSGASVPFRFDIHAMIFSYNAYKLEAELHQKFEKHRVNKVNNRKEFFNITIDDIEKALEKYGELTIEFYRDSEAEEFFETQKIESKQLVTVE